MSPRDTRLSDLRHSRSATQRTAERDAVFRFVPEQTGGAVRPQATLKKKLQKKPAIKRNRERKRNLPPLQHTHPHAHHIAPRTSKTFSAPKRNLSLRPCARLSAADFHPRLSAVNPPPPTISTPPLPTAPRPLGGRHVPRSSPGPEAVELRARPRRRVAGFQLARPAEPVQLPAAPSNTVPVYDGDGSAFDRRTCCSCRPALTPSVPARPATAFLRFCVSGSEVLHFACHMWGGQKHRVSRCMTPPKRSQGQESGEREISF